MVVDNRVFNSADAKSALKVFSGNIRHYIFTSSVAVYNDWQGDVELEEDRVDLDFRGDHPYAEGKREAESVFASLLPEEAPFPFTIIRPTVVEGPEDYTLRTWYWVQRVLDGNDLLLPKTLPETLLSHVYVDDVVQAIVNISNNSSSFYRVYNIAGREILNLREYIESIIGIIGSKTSIVEAPLEYVLSKIGIPDYSFPGFYVNVRLVASISRAINEIGFVPVSHAIWMRKTIGWIMENRRLLGNSVFYNKRSKELSLAHSISSTQA